MNKEYSLEEHVRHGTKEQPLTVMHFSAGKGTPYPEHFYVERHWHHNVELIRIQKGFYRAEINLETVFLSPGDLCMINSEELHLLEGLGPDTLHDVLIFDPCILPFSYEDEMQQTLILPFLSRQKVLPRVVRRNDPGYQELLLQFDRFMELGNQTEEDWYLKLKLEILRYLILLKEHQMFLLGADTLSAAEKERIDRYKCVISFMEENYASELTLDMLSVAAGCNPQYLCRFFKEIAGCSPIQYLIRYRIQQAKHLMTHTTKTILEISLECGFNNFSYFIRQFKKQTGQTPGEFRNSCR